MEFIIMIGQIIVFFSAIILLIILAGYVVANILTVIDKLLDWTYKKG